jgi:hypothetical protein
MTARDGFYNGTGIVDVTLSYSTETWGGVVFPGRSDNGFLQVSTAAVVANVIYKNHGWYTTGSVFEVWVTSGAPSTVPPSGHTLSDIDFVVLQG